MNLCGSQFPMHPLGNAHPRRRQCLPTNGFHFRQYQQAAPRWAVAVGGGEDAGDQVCSCNGVSCVCVLASAGVLTPGEVQSQDLRPVLAVQPRGGAWPCHPPRRNLLGPCQVPWTGHVSARLKRKHQQDTVKVTDCMAGGE